MMMMMIFSRLFIGNSFFSSFFSIAPSSSFCVGACAGFSAASALGGTSRSFEIHEWLIFSGLAIDSHSLALYTHTHERYIYSQHLKKTYRCPFRFEKSFGSGTAERVGFERLI
jgi:hypothetical protein